MQILQILDLAANTVDSVESLAVLQDKFISACLIDTGFDQSNACNMDESFDQHLGADVSFELQIFLSGIFCVEIRPQIVESKVKVRVRTVHLRDGMGSGSQDFHVLSIRGFEQDEELVAEEEETFLEFFSRVSKEAITQHAALIESVGVSAIHAKQAAQEFWDPRF